jgi:caspase 7
MLKMFFVGFLASYLIYDMHFAVANEDHSRSDCLVVAVLTHGDHRGDLYAKDKTYRVDELWFNFTADRCPSLAGKPKIFFIQVIL